MSLLAQLAAKIPKLGTELAATEALGLILRDRTAADTLTAAVRGLVPALPPSLRYTTQEAGVDGRPDIVGSDDIRQVLHLEGKFWAGLTPAQASGAYLQRLRDQHRDRAPQDLHVGALLFVVPPRRVVTMSDEVATLFSLTDQRTDGLGWHGRTSDGLTVAVTSWEEVLTRIAGSVEQAVAEDTRQLLDLVQEIDHHSFVPWTIEQRTDQEVPRRLMRLAGVVDTVYQRLLVTKAATADGRRRTITRGGPMAFGKQMLLGRVAVTFRLSLNFWARYGRTPLWLSFSPASALYARQAFPGDLIEADGLCLLPVPMPTDQLEDQTITTLVDGLVGVGRRLDAVLGDAEPPASYEEVMEEILDEVVVDAEELGPQNHQ